MQTFPGNRRKERTVQAGITRLVMIVQAATWRFARAD